MRQGTQIITGAFVIAALLSTPVAAQERKKSPPPPSPELFEALEACRAIADNVQRLACFDGTSAKLSAAVDAKQIVVIEEKEVKKTKRSLFGFRLPDLSIFGGNDNDSEEDKTLVTTIKSLGRAEGGRWNIGIPEGAVWQTTEAMTFNPKVGDAVEIKTGVMGGYFLRVGKKRAVRAKRIE
ncbi:hypothetical protein [Blastomonas sp. UPD001]|jgi:hypothetical protein|uniref:hypothetical protein n=1 Tax=unclassified Blastomonas TaxID=2626550 RepID=UPI000E35521E|nr:hypothetical protein [Blastomonas sp. UPD001]